VERRLDFREPAFDPLTDDFQAITHRRQLAADGLELIAHQLLALLFQAFACLNQLFQVAEPFLAGLGVGAQSGEPDLTAVVTNVTQQVAAGFHGLMDRCLGHVAPHDFQGTPGRSGLRATLGKKIRNHILNAKKIRQACSDLSSVRSISLLILPPSADNSRPRRSSTSTLAALTSIRPSAPLRLNSRVSPLQR